MASHMPPDTLCLGREGGHPIIGTLKVFAHNNITHRLLGPAFPVRNGTGKKFIFGWRETVATAARARLRAGASIDDAKMAPGPRLYIKHDLAHMRVRFHMPVRFGGFRKWEGFVDHDLDRSVFDERPYLLLKLAGKMGFELGCSGP